MDTARPEAYPGEYDRIGGGSGDVRTPVQQFLHDANVLPHFDLGDELQDLRGAHGDQVADEAEAAYRAMKEGDN